MVIHIDRNRKKNLIAFSILLMLACLFLSRALLSVSMIVFLSLTLLHKDIGQQLRTFFKNIFLVSITILFLVPLASGLWSSDVNEWAEILRIKAPLLFFPLAFAGSWQLDKKHWDAVAWGFIILIVIAASWSLLQYFADMPGINDAYLRSKTIITPLEDDHVRFSWLCAFGSLLAIFLIHRGSGKKTILIVITLFLILYLHILSARMGLFSVYIFLVLYAGWLVKRERSKKLSLAVIAGIVLLPLISWLIFPTFRNRIQYFLYDISLVREQQYVSGSNDGARIQSLKAGWEILKDNPGGVGAGDLKASVFSWYDVHVPAMRPGEKFLPCSEFLVYGGFAGWTGAILLLLVLSIPFFLKSIHHRFFWICLNSIVAFSFLMDMTIEAQFGVFIYVIIVLWWWKWLQLKPGDEK